MIRAATSSDAEAICRINNHYIAKTIIAFDEDAISVLEMIRRIDERLNADLPWFVLASDDRIIG